MSYPARQVRFEIEMRDGEALLATSTGVIARGVLGKPFVLFNK